MKKISNKVLIILLLVLVVLFVLNHYFRAPGLERNLPESIVRVDTAKVARVVVRRPGATTLVLARQAAEWTVEQGSNKAVADRSVLSGALTSLADIEPERLVSRKKEKWNDYAVGDSTLAVMVDVGNHDTTSFFIGKSNYGAGGTATYLRLSGEDDVYEVGGTLNSTFSRDFSGWRSKNFLQNEKANISKLTFEYPADSGFVAEKRDSIWWVAGLRADPQMIDRYLNTWQSKNIYTFSDSIPDVDHPDATIRAEGPIGALASVKAWKKENGDWILESSLQPGAYFLGKHPAISRDLMIGKGALIGSN